MKLKRSTYIILSVIGFCYGVWGGYLFGEDTTLLFGWVPLSVVSLFMTGVYASVINYLYFKNY